MGARGPRPPAERLDRTVREGKASRYTRTVVTPPRVKDRPQIPHRWHVLGLAWSGVPSTGILPCPLPLAALAPRPALPCILPCLWSPSSDPCRLQRCGVFDGNPCFASSGRHRPRGPTTRHQSISALLGCAMWLFMCRTAKGSREQGSPP